MAALVHFALCTGFLLCAIRLTDAQRRPARANSSKPSRQRGVCRIEVGELKNGYYVDANGRRLMATPDGGYLRVKPDRVIEARCDPGYGRRGPQYRKCLESTKTFDEDSPTCQDIDECNIPLPSSGDESEGSWESSSHASSWMSIDLEPELDYDPSTLSLVKCHSMARCVNLPGSFRCECYRGYEGDGVTSCEKVIPKACEPLEPPLHGSMKGDPTRLLRFTCDEGYRIFGARMRQCVGGRWNGLHPVCEVEGCGNPGTPANGFKVGDKYDVGYRVFFGCDEGYELAGPRERICLSGGDDYWSEDFWSGVQPVCRPKASSIDKIAAYIQTDFVDHLEVFTHSGRGRLAVSDNIGLDLVFAYDTSTSLNHVNFERGVNFTESLLRQFNVSYDRGGTRVAVISFADEAEIVFTYGEDVDTFEKTMARIHLLKDNLGGGTDLYGALEKVFDVIGNMRNGSKRALFIMTDGLANVGPDRVALAESLRLDERMEIFVIGVGEGIDRKQLRKIASQPYSTHVFLLQNFEDLAALTAIISEKGAEYVRCGQAGNLELPHVGNQQDSVPNANPGAWPWLAQVLRLTDDGQLLQCGGSLLCEDWVITAGSCVFIEVRQDEFVELRPDELRVRLGAYELGVREEMEQELGVSEVHLHGSYDPVNRYNDIALLRLNGSANLTRDVRTLCIPSEVDVVQLKSSSRCYIAGWGIVDPVEDLPKNDSEPSVFPKQLKISLVSDDICQAKMNHPYLFERHKMCAGKRYKSDKACRGDTGAPLVCQQIDRSWAVAGVTSYSQECTDWDKYAVFTRLSEFRPWLREVMGNCTEAYQAVAVGGFH